MRSGLFECGPYTELARLQEQQTEDTAWQYEQAKVMKATINSQEGGGVLVTKLQCDKFRGR